MGVKSTKELVWLTFLLLALFSKTPKRQLQSEKGMSIALGELIKENPWFQNRSGA